MGATKTITSETFDQDITNGPAVIDFSATWCGPCQLLAPEIEKMATEYAGKVTVGKVDVDQDPDLAARFNVASVPTVLFFKDGQKVDQILGNRADSIRSRIESLIQ